MVLLSQSQDLDNHSFLEEVNHGCMQQQDRMEIEERLPSLWEVNCYTGSFTLKICTFNNSLACLIIAALGTSLMPFIRSI